MAIVEAFAEQPKMIPELFTRKYDINATYTTSRTNARLSQRRSRRPTAAWLWPSFKRLVDTSSPRTPRFPPSPIGKASWNTRARANW